MDELQRYLQDHKHAPKWNYEATDRLTPEMLECIHSYEGDLSHVRKDREEWQAYLKENVERVLQTALDHTLFFKRASRYRSLEPIMEKLVLFPTTDRSLIVQEPWAFIPENADYSEMVMYYSTGTTGHPVGIPKHPLSVGLYCSFLKEALQHYDIQLKLDPTRLGVSVALVGYQEETVTFPTRLSVLGNTGFVKLNVKANDWSQPTDPCHYLSDLQPQVLTGDPLSFTQLARLFEESGLPPIHPKALVPTAVALSDKVKEHLEAFFECPVIDWYSLTETGPLGYACPSSEGYHLLPPDILVEVLDENGDPVSEGEIGEITVTGGRNPYLPLVRYRTGDWGAIQSGPCECGEMMPKLLQLEGRRPVVFQTSDGKLVNNADVAAVLRQFPILEYEFVQNKDLSCYLRFALIPGPDAKKIGTEIQISLGDLFGNKINVDVESDEDLLNRPRTRKLIPFKSHIPLLYD